VSSQESSPSNQKDIAIAPSSSTEEGGIPHQLAPSELEALRTLFLLLDRWDREEGCHEG
jgi:hypothetical protein